MHRQGYVHVTYCGCVQICASVGGSQPPLFAFRTLVSAPPGYLFIYFLLICDSAGSDERNKKSRSCTDAEMSLRLDAAKPPLQIPESVCWHSRLRDERGHVLPFLRASPPAACDPLHLLAKRPGRGQKGATSHSCGWSL